MTTSLRFFINNNPQHIEMRKWNRQKIIKELRKITRDKGISPGVNQIPSYLYGACYNYFGSFNKAKKAAGLKIEKMKYNPIKKSAHKISKEFMYILGVIYGDGYENLTENEHGSSGRISLAVTDQDFALTFKKYLEKWSGLKAKYKINEEGLYQIILYSVDACRIIEKIDLKRIPKLKKEFGFMFLRGLFDSDGGVIGENLDNRKIAKRWVHLSNNNHQLLALTKTIFNRLKIDYSMKGRIKSGFGSKKMQYQINIYNLRDIFKYYKFIGFNTKRKIKKLERVINSYEEAYLNKVNEELKW